MRRTFLASVLLAAIAGVYACSEATDGLVGYDVVIVPAEAGATEPAGDEPAAPAKTFDAQTVTTGVVVLNELSADDDWIELVNSGDAEVDLDGWQVADRDKDTGEPKLSEAVTFPPGTKLAPGAYALVNAGDNPDPCPGPGLCFHAKFGISNKDGETIFLVRADGGVAGALVYPPDAANGAGLTWGRTPSGDPAGTFAITPATPGAANTP
ncbi:MAG: lamin tail domain-containing protein [Labilithrix sp.]|nr:lamin tail domain-containing protein [Labilithrix sp.]MCW5816259.1 lamin tail domain-containing protein [Labilithrix sp.]